MSVGLVVQILGDASSLGRTLDGVKSKSGGFAGTLGGTTLKMAAFASVAGIAANAMWDMTQAAMEDRAEQERLDAALVAAGVATGDYKTQVDAAIAAGQARAFSDTQTREALQSLVTATGDLDLATADLTVAQDLARFANVDLATAADAVAKAHAGQDRQLKTLLPGIASGATAMDTLATATAAAAGQADAYAASSKGMQERAVDAFSELGETLGEVFIPALETVLPVLLPVLDELGKLVTELLPVFKITTTAMLIPLRLLVTVIGILVDWLSKLVTWLGDAIAALGRFLDSVNPLKGITLPSLPFLSSSPAAASSSAGVGRSAGRAAAAPAAFAPSITIYTTGDGIEAEQAVVRALRRVTRLNGGVVPALGWTGAR